MNRYWFKKSMKARFSQLVFTEDLPSEMITK